ncbi:MAG: LssY C-terminal domain-containing protein, partial [Candidatus Magasanikbacteria bacterium]|nr:LssY C-terminal domain-containing protein [Candidatus Magasanikbacteria bacterium]
YVFKRILIKRGKAVIQIFISLAVSVWGGIKADSHIQKFVSRHPGLVNFLAQRFDRKKFSGLPLTVLALIFVYALSSFIGAAIDISRPSDLQSADFSLANLLYAFRHPLPVKIFLWITLLGEWRMAVAITFVSAVLFWLWGKREYVLPLILSVAGGAASGALAKLIWHRPRPAGAVGVYLEKSWSFPSGHAILAVSLYGFLIYFFWRNFKKWGNKINALFIGLLMILFIGFSRLYLGVHYLSDVWGGYLIGLMWLVISAAMVLKRPKREEAARVLPRAAKIIGACSIFLLAVFYAAFALRYKPHFNASAETVAPRIVADEKVNGIFPDYNLPKFTETLTGNAQEPLSFLIIARDDKNLEDSFKKMEWYAAEEINFNSLAAALKSVILNKSYPTAPMTPSFWNTYTNDFGFELPTEKDSVRYRHHARFWKTNFITSSGGFIYAGVTSLDAGVKWLGVTHRIKPDIDSDREFLFSDMMKAGVVKDFRKEKFVEPVLGQNFTGDQFFTDGQIYVVYLKP